MTVRARPARGFTLLEIMVVMAIIGILSTIALPSFRTYQFRSKQAERAIMLASIHHAVEEYYVREARFPTDLIPGQWSILWLTTANPDANPGTTKRPWRQTRANASDGWFNLSLLVEGGVYYSYYGYAYALAPSQRYTWLRARGDLDGDGIISELNEYWHYLDDRLQRWTPSNVPCNCTQALDLTTHTF